MHSAKRSVGSCTVIFSAPPGAEVHTPPCFVQNEQPQARTGISRGVGSQSSAKDYVATVTCPIDAHTSSLSAAVLE